MRKLKHREVELLSDSTVIKYNTDLNAGLAAITVHGVNRCTIKPPWKAYALKDCVLSKALNIDCQSWSILSFSDYTEQFTILKGTFTAL